jgi:hypothetical protein
MLQSNLDLPLNTKSVHNYITEFLWKFGNFWDSDFYVMNFCSYLPAFYVLTHVDIDSMSNV